MVMNEKDLEVLVKESISFTEVARKLGYSNVSGQKIKQVREMCKEYDTSHFRKNGQRPKWESIEKTCPVCGKKFQTLKGHPREKQVCSCACSNTYFRSGPQHGNWNQDAYRTTCFYYHEKECIICGEKNIVEVHHYDENKANNSPENLIPLCPTHHQYVHSRYKGEVQNDIDNYRKDFISKQKK